MKCDNCIYLEEMNFVELNYLYLNYKDKCFDWCGLLDFSIDFLKDKKFDFNSCKYFEK